MDKFKLPNGYFIRIKPEDDPVKVYQESIRIIFESKKIKITPEIEVFIYERATALAKKHHQELIDQGVPEKFKTLFSLEKKKEIERFLDKMEITDEELHLLIYNRSQIGFQYQSKFKQFVPSHLELTDEDGKYVGEKSDKGIKARKKIFQSFEERKHTHMHLFTRKKEWYCFFFDFKDIQPEKLPNHWVGGSHIHFVSHHWGMNYEDVVAQFENRKISLPKVHVKFKMERDKT